MADSVELQGTDTMEDQAREQTGQQQVTLHVDERSMQSTYANAFRTNGSAEEVMLDFGVNQMRPPSQSDNQSHILFQASQRIVLNYYSAKRLAIALGQVVRRYEDRFGELELDVAKRGQTGK